MKIARMDLEDRLAEDDWSLAETEKLIRRIEKLEGDEAPTPSGSKKGRKILTDNQLKKARTGPGNMQLEELF